MKKIPYAHQWIDPSDVQEVVKTLKSDWITQGPRVKAFEDALCKYTGAKYAVAVSSGTAALHLSIMALNVSRGDRVITSPITFAASANCALYVGAIPKFIDMDDQTYHLDVEKLKVFLKSPYRRKKVKVVIPVHFMGTVANIQAIKKICDKYGIKVLEDAAHALGAKYKVGKKWLKVGCCQHSNVTIFSFHPIKNITTGEGGVLLTNNRKIYEKARQLRHHGMVKVKTKPQWFYDIPEVGFNYRITDFQCALGVSQLKKLDRMVKERKRLVKRYNEEFASLKQMQLPFEKPGTYGSYHLYVVRVPENKRNGLYETLRKNNILTQVNYIPVHLLSFYQKQLGYKRRDFPVAERYFGECLSLPLYYGLTQRDQQKVVRTVKEFFRNGK